ncbi:hypothetical protein [Streptosporangium sp. V21-05]|uniref:hypothetical protein n=1 Tax=Streptosporangium sp. V21-05 TaxID=3446115 RepID=UPI003F52E556
MPDFLDVVHSLWIEWRTDTLRTSMLLTLAGAGDEFEPDPHAAFDDLFAPPAAPVRRDSEERRAMIARFAAG